MKLKKITHGFVVQTFDTEKGEWVSQEFVAGDDTEYETEIGNPLRADGAAELAGGEEPYLPFDMVQPGRDVGQAIRDAIGETGVFVNPHIDDLIDLLEQSVSDALRESSQGDE